MLLKDRNRPLYEALKSFSVAALGVIENAVKYSDVRIPVLPMYSWQPDAQSADSFSRQPVQRPEYWILLYKLQPQIKELDSYHSVEIEIKSDDIWSSHLNKMVGSSKRRHRLTLDRLLAGIPIYSLRETNNFCLSEQHFNEKVEMLECFFTSTNVDYIKTTPLYGITLSDEFALSDSISIKPLSTDNTIELLNDGLDPPSTYNFGDISTVQDVPSAAIITRFTLPKVVVADGDKEQKDLTSLIEQLNRISLDQEIAVDLLRLILNGDIRPLGSIMKSKGYLDGSLSIQKYDVNNAWAIAKKSFEKMDQQKLKELWPIFDGSNRRPLHFLVIAVRRFSLAMTRTSLEDRLIDLMICAEAIFLRVDSNELSDKLAYRAALLLGKNSVNKKEIFKFFKDAYTLRSKVVHGSKSFVQDAKDADEQTSRIGTLSDHLRNAIVIMLDRALAPHSPEGLIDWKELMFPEPIESE